MYVYIYLYIYIYIHTGEGPLLRVQPVTPPRAGIHRQGICHEEPYAVRSLYRRVDTCVCVRCRGVGYVGWVYVCEHVCCAVVCPRLSGSVVLQCCVCVVVLRVCCARQRASCIVGVGAVNEV